MSSVKTRKHYVIFDLGFSGIYDRPESMNYITFLLLCTFLIKTFLLKTQNIKVLLTTCVSEFFTHYASLAGFWAFLYFVSFCVMTHQWSKSPEPSAGYGHSNIGGAIFFSFVSIFIWVNRIIYFIEKIGKLLLNMHKNPDFKSKFFYKKSKLTIKTKLL